MKQRTDKEILNEVSKHLFGLRIGDIVEANISPQHSRIGKIVRIFDYERPNLVFYSIRVESENTVYSGFGLKDLRLIRRKEENTSER